MSVSILLRFHSAFSMDLDVSFSCLLIDVSFSKAAATNISNLFLMDLSSVVIGTSLWASLPGNKKEQNNWEFSAHVLGVDYSIR